MTTVKRQHLLITTLVLLFCLGSNAYSRNNESNSITVLHGMKKDSVLRHVVLFKFKEGTSTSDLHSITTAFSELSNKIDKIKDFEWGLNNSPEGLEKGFTHCFLVTFRSDADRDSYLPHPDHKAFVDLASPFIADVLVVDYWTD